MVSEPRTRDARTRAEEVLVTFALLAGAHAQDFVVIGGLNPDFLAPNAPVPHLGTTDVDLLFELGFVYERDEDDYGWLDGLLAASGFVARENGWQWDAIVGGSLVRLDLLCDVHDSPGQTLALPGAEIAAVQNLAGPAPALSNSVTRALTVSDLYRAEHPDAPAQVSMRFASLGGYLTAKSAALLSRGLGKDAYDLIFVSLFNPGGPAAAAKAVREVETGDPYRPQPTDVVLGAARRLLADRLLLDAFVDSMREAGDDEPPEILRMDATVGLRRLIEKLDAA